MNKIISWFKNLFKFFRKPSKPEPEQQKQEKIHHERIYGYLFGVQGNHSTKKFTRTF